MIRSTDLTADLKDPNNSNQTACSCSYVPTVLQDFGPRISEPLASKWQGHAVDSSLFLTGCGGILLGLGMSGILWKPHQARENNSVKCTRHIVWRSIIKLVWHSDAGRMSWAFAGGVKSSCSFADSSIHPSIHPNFNCVFPSASRQGLAQGSQVQYHHRRDTD